MEIEIKLAPASRAAAEKILSGENFYAGPASVVRMDAEYFDTPDRRLRALGFSLRRRREGERTVCCLKGNVRGNTRTELELAADDIDAAAEAFAQSPEVPLPAAAVLLSHDLRPVFASRFERTLRPARCGSSEIEICFDSGELSQNGRFAAISEVELELKSGEESDLTALAGYICGKYGLSECRGTKAARASALTEELFASLRPADGLMKSLYEKGLLFRRGDEYFVSPEGEKLFGKEL